MSARPPHEHRVALGARAMPAVPGNERVDAAGQRGDRRAACGRLRAPMRQVVLDTETTGLEAERGHRIIEIGCVEMREPPRHRPAFPRIPEPRARHRRRRRGRARHHAARSSPASRASPRSPRRFLEFVDGARAGDPQRALRRRRSSTASCALGAASAATPVRIRKRCTVLDTLALAREMHPGQRNGLDALCKRYCDRQFAPRSCMARCSMRASWPTSTWP